MNRACGAAALVRVINPDCECKSGAAPERISKGMYEYSGEAYLGHFTVLFFFFFFFVCACKRQFPQTHGVVAVLSVPVRDWEGKPVWRTRAWQEKKKGGSC